VVGGPIDQVVPQAEILAERVAGWPKNLVAYRR
jgi:hypothetical protein